MDDSRTPRTTEILPPSASGRLALIVAPLHGGAARFALPDRGTITLGGAWASVVDDETRVDLADPTVSARHARIEVIDGAVRIVDLGSRNGTWLGGARVESADMTVGACAILGRSAVSIEEIAASHERDDGGGTVDEPFPGAIGRAPSMRLLGARIRTFAPLSASVLIQGESGAGKEVVARALHLLSPRKRGPFHAINLGALPRELAEAELFGHERGAFTGATGQTAGVFEHAHGGTLLLDELGELPLEMQAKLLRVLETGEVRRLGARVTKKVDVRVVAATWQPLERRVAEGTFRQDLFHRIAVLMVEVPPLRERRGDIPAIAARVLALHRDEVGDKTLSPAVASKLAAGSWPGNVRELKNVVYRAAVLAEGATIEPLDLARAMSTSTSSPPPPLRMRDATAAMGIVKAHGNNVSAAARATGIPRETLRDWVREARRDGLAVAQRSSKKSLR